jgi:hypothetical protein
MSARRSGPYKGGRGDRRSEERSNRAPYKVDEFDENAKVVSLLKLNFMIEHACTQAISFYCSIVLFRSWFLYNS